MILLLTSFIAALVLWPLLRALMNRLVLAANPIQAPGPDSLYFEMRSGLMVAAGTRVSQLLGYRSARDCLAHFDRAAHFKNASLVQLMSGQMDPAELVLQNVQGQALNDDLRIEVFQGSTGVVVQAAVKVERRASTLRQSSGNLLASPKLNPMVPAQSTGPFSVLAASHAVDSVETYHALIETMTSRLQPSPDLCLRIGFPVKNRGLTAPLWRRCLVPGVWEDVLNFLKQPQMNESIVCAVSTLAGEMLSLRVTLLALPDSWNGPHGQATGDRRTCLLKIQVCPYPDQAQRRLLEKSVQPNQADALSSPERIAQSSSDGFASEHDAGNTLSDARPLTSEESDDAAFNTPERAEGSAGRVLLIEDDPMIHKALLPMLSEAGLSARTASSLSQAINYLQTETFDLVITDRNLGNDSIQPLLDKMTAVGSALPVLLVTAEPFDHPAVYRVLAKPFDLVRFQRFLDEGLQAMNANQRQLLGFRP